MWEVLTNDQESEDKIKWRKRSFKWINYLLRDIHAMKILFLTYDYGGTASGIMSQRMAAALVQQGCHIHVLAGKVKNDKPDERITIEVIKESFCWKIAKNVIKAFIKLIGGSPYNSNYDWRINAKKKAYIILKNWNPNIVYCRTTPIDPCYVGMEIKKKFKCVVVQHFTDPIPPPREYSTGNIQTYIDKQLARKVLLGADFVSFGNEYMRDFMLRTLRMSDSTNYFISYDIAPHSKLFLLPHSTGTTIRLVYLGNIYQSRNIKPLFEAIKKLRHDGLDIVLDIYNGHDALIDDGILEHQYVSNTFEIMAGSSILIDLDGDGLTPVYTSSKLKEYLTVNRPILAISPEDSPSSELLKGMVTCEVVRNNYLEIYHVIRRILSLKYDDLAFEERERLLKLFSPESVAKTFIQKVTLLHD